MANGSTTLARIQGRGLVETAPVGIAEMEGAGFSPAGALQKGLSPDSAKMAGTPPAKVNAIRMAMQDVGSRRLGALREMAAPQFAADTRATSDIARQASVFGRLDNAMSDYITTSLTAAFNLSILAEGNTQAKLKSTIFPGNKVAQDKLLNAIANINNNKGTDADVKIINDALGPDGLGVPDRISLKGDTSAKTNATTIANNFFENLTPEQMQKAFGDAVAKASASTKVGNFLASNDADTFALAQPGLVPEGTASDKASDYLRDLLLAIVPGADAAAKEAALNAMDLKQLTTALQTWREQNFQDVTAYQKTLADPSASPAQQQLALENLRRLGQVGVLAADVKIGDIDAQMRDGDKLKIGTATNYQEFDIASFFKEPEKLAQLKGWLDKPDTAPETLRPWIEGNRDALQNKIGELSPDLQKLSDTVKENMKAVNLPVGLKLDDETSEYFFGDLNKPTIAAKVVPEKYKLLQDPTTGPAMLNLLTSLKNISQKGVGLDGKVLFDSLTADQMKTILTTNGVQRYIDNIVRQKQVKDFVAADITEANFANTFRLLVSDNLQLDDAGISISRLANRDLSQFTEIFKRAGLNNLLVGGKLNINTIKDKLKEFANGDANSLISGDGMTALKDYLNNQVMGKIRDSLARVPREPEPPQSNGEEMPFEFHQNGEYKQTPAQRRKSLEWDLSPLSGLSFSIGKARKDLDEHNKEEPLNWLGGKDKDWTKWKQEQERLEAILGPLEEQRRQTERDLNDLPNWTARRQSSYEKWREKEVAKRDEKDAEYQRIYNNFANLLGGLI